MFYKNFSQLAADVDQWASRLPRFAAVCGVPRSGVLVASLIALRLNLPLVSLENLLVGKLEAPAALRRARWEAGPVLIVDDALDTGHTIRLIKERLPPGIEARFASYVAGPGKDVLDYWYYSVGKEPHLFEWCVLRHPFNSNTLTDLDGVLCPNWPHDREDGDLADKYQQHLEEAPCLLRPTPRLKGVVTNRLEKHRKSTEAWLNRHGIEYEFLAMSPWRTPKERREQDGKPCHKARVFKDWGNLFVESDPQEAQAIRDQTGKLVLCWETQELLDPIFTHGGDTGDTLAALAYIAYRGGGQLRLTPRPGMVRDPFTQAKVERLRPLLERQPYIRGVSFGEPLGVNLDEWRQRMRGRLNLADYVSQAFDAPHYPRDKPWLYCDEPNPVAPVVCHRSPRYHGSDELWRKIMKKYNPEQRVFVGLPDEHAAFERTFGSIRYFPTADYWELARVLAGARVCCHNQSSPYWVTAGLCLQHQKVILEVCGYTDNCHFERPWHLYCRDNGGGDITLPEI